MKVKGSALKARLRWALEKGEPAWRQFLSALSPATRSLASQGVMVNAWYPFDALIEISEVLDRQHGKGDLALCYELGRHSCDFNLASIYDVLIVRGSVQTFVQRVPTVWRVNYDFGELKVIENTEGSARLRISGVTQPHRAHCLSALGWIERGAEIAGGAPLSTTETCRCLGDAYCDLVFRY